jgi:hypothetical protein
MDPFVLSRNVFHSYCSEYQSKNLDHETAIRTINQRYEYFLQTLDRLRISFEETTRNRNINSISNSAKDTLTLPSPTKKRSNKKYIQKSNKQRMPKIMITVSCAEHRTKQQPNIKIN